MGTSAVFRANSTFKTGFAKIKNKYKKQNRTLVLHSSRTGIGRFDGYEQKKQTVSITLCTSLLLGTHLLKVLLQLFKFIKV